MLWSYCEGECEIGFETEEEFFLFRHGRHLVYSLVLDSVTRELFLTYEEMRSYANRRGIKIEHLGNELDERITFERNDGMPFITNVTIREYMPTDLIGD